MPLSEGLKYHAQLQLQTQLSFMSFVSQKVKHFFTIVLFFTIALKKCIEHNG